MPEHVKQLWLGWWRNDDDHAGNMERYRVAREAEDEWQKSIPHEVMETKDTEGNVVPIYLPNDSEYRDLKEIGEEAGQSYNDHTAGECAARLVALKAKGFIVPQRVIDELMQEQKEVLS